MRPMLEDIELPQVQEITTRDRRVLAEHKPPGMSGSLLQNLGRRPMQVLLWGVVSGADAAELVEQLEEKYRAGQSLSFSADITAEAEIEQVLISDLRFREVAGRPEHTFYALVLKEYIEPVEPEDPSAVDGEILEESEEIMDGLIDGLDLSLDLSTGLERFVSPLSSLLGRLREARSGQERGGTG